jgi:hypothetical protein
MTKVILESELMRRIEDGALLERIAAAHGIYGIFRVTLAPSMDRITVEYDASRLTPSQVESALRGFGIPIATTHAAS